MERAALNQEAISMCHSSWSPHKWRTVSVACGVNIPLVPATMHRRMSVRDPPACYRHRGLGSCRSCHEWKIIYVHLQIFVYLVSSVSEATDSQDVAEDVLSPVHACECMPHGALWWDACTAVMPRGGWVGLHVAGGVVGGAGSELWVPGWHDEFSSPS